MNLDSLTIGEVRQLGQFLGSNGSGSDHPYEIGAIYFIRSVTFFYTGRLVRVTPLELVLEDAAWIADTGRFADALKEGASFAEVEPYPNGHVILGRSAIVDAVKYHTTPRTQQ